VTARKKPNGLRAALAAKKVLTTYYDIPIVDRQTVDAIVERLQEARADVTRYRHADEPMFVKRFKEAQESERAVKAELDACFYRVTFRALKNDAQIDRLLNAYPATEEQIEKAKAAGTAEADLPDLDTDSFNVAYLVACILNSDLTADEWRAELWSDKWTEPDRAAIFARVHQANTAEFNVGIPKD
jgi:hypothetical protein